MYVGWNGHNTTASTEIYEVDRDLWTDLESSENYFSTSGCGIAHLQSPASDEWQTCSNREIWCNPKVSLVDGEAMDPLCYSLVEIEGMASEFAGDMLNLYESLDKQVREQYQELYRYVNLYQASRRKEKAEDCFNRARIDSLKSQILAFRISEEGRSRSRAENLQSISKDVYSIVQECSIAVRMISDLIQTENDCLSSIMMTTCQVRALQETTRACKVDAMNMHTNIEKLFSNLHFTATELTDMVGICETARKELECVGKGAGNLIAEAAQSKRVLQLCQASLKTVEAESRVALRDVSRLQQQFHKDFQSQRQTKKMLENLCSDCELTNAEFSIHAESYKHFFESEHPFRNTAARPESNIIHQLLTSKINGSIEQGNWDEMIRLMGLEVMRRTEAEERVEMLTQMNFEVTTKYQRLLEEMHFNGHPKCIQTRRSESSRLVNSEPLDPTPVEAVTMGAACKEKQYLDEMIRLMGEEVIRRVEAEKMVEILTQINFEVTSNCKKCSESKKGVGPVYSESSKTKDFVKSTELDPIMINGVKSEAASKLGNEQWYLDEMIHLLGAEVIRRVEAEKTIESLSQRKSKVPSDCKFSERNKLDHVHISTERNRPICLAKAVPSCSISVEGVKMNSACSNEQGHSDELIRLMGAEVIRRVEAEKMVEVLTEMNLEVTANYEKKMSAESANINGQDHSQGNEKEKERKLSLLNEEKRIVEAALELEIINNKTLRTEIDDLKSQLSREYESETERHLHHVPDVHICLHSPKSNQSCRGEYREGLTITSEASHDQEVQNLKEMVAVRNLELEACEMYIQNFSGDMVLLFSKLALVLTSLQVNCFTCLRRYIFFLLNVGWIDDLSFQSNRS
jgi:hypothetical protein